MLPRSTFKRIVKQEAARHSTETVRFNVDAVDALQAAAEQELTTIFSGAAFIAGIAKRETITCEDMTNFQNLRELYYYKNDEFSKNKNKIKLMTTFIYI